MTPSANLQQTALWFTVGFEPNFTGFLLDLLTGGKRSIKARNPCSVSTSENRWSTVQPFRWRMTWWKTPFFCRWMPAWNATAHLLIITLWSSTRLLRCSQPGLGGTARFCISDHAVFQASFLVFLLLNRNPVLSGEARPWSQIYISPSVQVQVGILSRAILWRLPFKLSGFYFLTFPLNLLIYFFWMPWSLQSTFYSVGFPLLKLWTAHQFSLYIFLVPFNREIPF